MGEMFFRAVLCNFFVCLAVLCGIKLKEETAKILMIMICISGFVISGFEHCYWQTWGFCDGICHGHKPFHWGNASQSGCGNTGQYGGSSGASGMALRKMSADK